LPRRRAFPLTRLRTGVNARRAIWAVEPESFDAAMAEPVIVSRTSFDWRETDSAEVRLAAIDISATDADIICLNASAAIC
jgi:hypothetical protein